MYAYVDTVYQYQPYCEECAWGGKVCDSEYDAQLLADSHNKVTHNA